MGAPAVNMNAALAVELCRQSQLTEQQIVDLEAYLRDLPAGFQGLSEKAIANHWQTELAPMIIGLNLGKKRPYDERLRPLIVDALLQALPYFIPEERTQLRERVGNIANTIQGLAGEAKTAEISKKAALRDDKYIGPQFTELMQSCTYRAAQSQGSDQRMRQILTNSSNKDRLKFLAQLRLKDKDSYRDYGNTLILDLCSKVDLEPRDIRWTKAYLATLDHNEKNIAAVDAMVAKLQERGDRASPELLAIITKTHEEMHNPSPKLTERIIKTFQKVSTKSSHASVEANASASNSYGSTESQVEHSLSPTSPESTRSQPELAETDEPRLGENVGFEDMPSAQVKEKLESIKGNSTEQQENPTPMTKK